MHIHFSGSWNITVTSSIAPGVNFGSPKRFVVAGAQVGSGTYDGEPTAIGLSFNASGTDWTLTLQNQEHTAAGNWIDSPVQLSIQPDIVVIGSNDEDQGDTPPYDDLVLTCTALPDTPVLAPGRAPRLGTWVSWGVKVDAGGPTGHGPVPPWAPFLADLGAGFALGEAAHLVRAELRGAVLDLAARQVGEAAGAITKAMKGSSKAV